MSRKNKKQKIQNLNDTEILNRSIVLVTKDLDELQFLFKNKGKTITYGELKFLHMLTQSPQKEGVLNIIYYKTEMSNELHEEFKKWCLDSSNLKGFNFDLIGGWEFINYRRLYEITKKEHCILYYFQN